MSESQSVPAPGNQAQGSYTRHAILSVCRSLDSLIVLGLLFFEVVTVGLWLLGWLSIEVPGGVFPDFPHLGSFDSAILYVVGAVLWHLFVWVKALRAISITTYLWGEYWAFKGTVWLLAGNAAIFAVVYLLPTLFQAMAAVK